MTIQEAARRSGPACRSRTGAATPACPGRGPHTAGERRRMLEAHRVRVTARIAELSQDLGVLDYRINLCKETS
ncbi:MerR family transcriptional regulator [Nonomuraea recticatena]